MNEYILYSRLNQFKRKLDRARRIVSVALDVPGASYVAFSGGKDSTVVANLVWEQDPSIPGIWSDDEFFLPETKDYIERTQEKYDVRQIRTNASHTEWFNVEGDWNGIQEYATHHNMYLVFLGLRKEENSYRRLHLSRFGELFFSQYDDIWHCNPIASWSWMDVWAYIRSNELDYNRAYDKLGEIGIEPRRQRIGPLAQRRALGYGQLSILKRGWPELFDQFADKFPEARSYV